MLVNGVRKIAPEENCFRSGSGFGLGLALELGLGGNFPRTLVNTPGNWLWVFDFEFVICKVNKSRRHFLKI